MRTLPLSALLLALGSSAHLLHAEEQIFLSGAHLAVVPLINGGIDAGGDSVKWDEGYRVELHLRDYYFRQQHHHPFAELGFFYEEHNVSRDGFSVDSQTIALRGAVGSAIPLWRAVDDSVMLGLTPELGVHVGGTSFDADTNGTRSDDDAFRYGASAGLNGWVVFNHAFSLGLGVVGSYWRTTSVELTVPDGLGTDERSDTVSGWDLGIRLSAGFVF